VDNTTKLAKLTIGKGASVSAKEDYLVTMTVNGVETAIKEGTYTGNIVLTVTPKLTTNPSSYNGRGIEDYRTAAYIDATGLVQSESVSAAVTGGQLTNTEAKNITVNSNSDNFTGVMVNGGEYSIKHSNFNFISNSDGSNVSDFTGLGAVVSAYNNAKVTMDHVNINSKGVARPALYADGGADMMITDSFFKVLGGTLYTGYVNSADQTKMVAPPWVLGITGNARGTNLMGNCSTTTVVRTSANANQWGVLSTDSGSDMVMNVVDSDLTLLGEGQKKDPYSTNYGSGYGTYIIGGAQEHFYGVTFNVGTYASILTGGDAVYASSRFTKPLDIYPLKHVPNGTTVTDPMSHQTSEGYDVVKSDTPVFTGITGLGRNTVINSDAFGFMAHNSGSLTVTDGTEVNTDNATFLMKSGDVNINVNGNSKINAKDGVILQMIDNDDSIVGADMSSGNPVFNTEFNEAAGYPGIDYAVNNTNKNSNTINFNAAEVVLNGNLYNGTGYFGGAWGGGLQAPDKLNVNLGSGAVLNGTISSTSVIHVDEKGKQNTRFTIDQYYYLGHVANKSYYNGGNDVSVTLKGGATWNITDSGTITSLTVEQGCKINGTVKVNGTIMSVDQIIGAGGTLTGTIEVSK
jgi:hypothetical protein